MSWSSAAWLPADPQTPFEHAGALVAGVVALVAVPFYFAPMVIWRETTASRDGAFARSSGSLAEGLVLLIIGVLLWFTSRIVVYQAWVTAGRSVSKVRALTKRGRAGGL